MQWNPFNDNSGNLCLANWHIPYVSLVQSIQFFLHKNKNIWYVKVILPVSFKIKLPFYIRINNFFTLHFFQLSNHGREWESSTKNTTWNSVCLRRVLWYVWYVRFVCRLFHSVNIYLRRLFQYPLSTLDDDASVCTSRARLAYVLVYLPPPSIYRVPKENLNHEILRVLSLSLSLCLSLSFSEKGGAAAAAASYRVGTYARAYNAYTSPYLSSACVCAWVLSGCRKERCGGQAGGGERRVGGGDKGGKSCCMDVGKRGL